MRLSQEKIVAILSERAEHEWQKLQKLHELVVHGEQELRSVGEQRARWAAWDTALEIAKGNGVTSFETEQRSV